MPQVFKKNCKISIIEYGESSHNVMSMKDLIHSISSTFKAFFKV